MYSLAIAGLRAGVIPRRYGLACAGFERTGEDLAPVNDSLRAHEGPVHDSI